MIQDIEVIQNDNGAQYINHKRKNFKNITGNLIRNNILAIPSAIIKNRLLTHFSIKFTFTRTSAECDSVIKYINKKDKSSFRYDSDKLEKYIKNKITNTRNYILFNRHGENKVIIGANYHEHSLLNTSNIIKLDTATYLFYKYIRCEDDKYNDTIELYFIGKHISKAIKEFSVFIHDNIGICKQIKKENSLLIVDLGNPGYSSYNQSSFLPKKYFDSLAYDNDTIDTIKKFLIRFDNNYDRYKESNIIYKTGILLYGKPGTGKTSIVKAIASEYDLAIIPISPDIFNRFDDQEEMNIKRNIPKQIKSLYAENSHELSDITNYGGRPVIVLFDDFDVFFTDRNSNLSTKDDQIIINKLLSLLDSIESPENVIFIATTNYIDKIDPAILRAGRFDLKLEIKGLNREGAFKFGKKFGLPDDTINKVLDDYDTDEYIQAELQNKFMNAFVDNINEE